MYRVLLVDDEPFARMGLRSTFDWERSGFELVGEASNGKNALPWIDRSEVDILITDIAMPVMDGLELMRAARERCPWIKIVLLSCHSDFAYVREGIRMGASDYLLKPTLEPADLKEVLDKVKLQIEEERKRNEIYSKQQLSRQRTELEKAFTKLLAGEAEAIPMDKDLPWLMEGYRIVVCALDGAAKLSSEEGGVFIEIVIDEVQESFYRFAQESIAFRSSTDQLIFVMPEPPGAEAHFMERLSCFHAQLKEKGLSFSLGVSGKFTEAVRLQQAVREGRQAVNMRFYEGPGEIRRYDCVPCLNAGKDDTEGLRSMLKNSLTEADKQRSFHYLQCFFKYWSSEYKTPKEVKREAHDLLSLFQLSSEHAALTLAHIEALPSMESAGQVQELVTTAFNELWKPEEESEENYGFHRRIVGSAIEYLQQNYRNEISLQEVAEHVAMSKNYFSELFKKITGQNFIDYLISLRLKCACELLSTTMLKVYEVAEMSGFNDVKYFSKVFKKVLKVSPADYREGRR